MPWDLHFFNTSTFVNLAISNINPAGYREFYPVLVLGELAHVKEREHEKHVDQTAKSAKYQLVGTRVPRRGDVVPKYLSTASYWYLHIVQVFPSHIVVLNIRISTNLRNCINVSFRVH